MTEKLCRWGILGTAGIARKNWKAIQVSENSCVTAVASRNVDSAQRFIDECSSQVPPKRQPVAVGSYEELLSRSDVDAVYIPLPTALRHPWVIQAAEAGKHVLAEKPAAKNADEVAQMLDACQRHNVQYMDGVMFMHSQRLQMLRKILDNTDQLGTIRRIATQFSFAGDETFCKSNIRTHSELEPYGCLGDLGWYCARITLWLLKGEMPIEVRARTLRPLQATNSPATVPGEFSAELVFASGITASFYCSFVTQHQQWLHVSGSRGYLRVDDFVLPFQGNEVKAVVGHDNFAIDNCTFHMQHNLEHFSVREHDAGAADAQEVRMIGRFSDIVLSGKLDPTWPTWTLNTQRVLDACFNSAQRDGASVKL